MSFELSWDCSSPTGGGDRQREKLQAGADILPGASQALHKWVSQTVDKGPRTCQPATSYSEPSCPRSGIFERVGCFLTLGMLRELLEFSSWKKEVAPKLQQ